jgi:murein L,D-transpeptidase YcbB/YkuD
MVDKAKKLDSLSQLDFTFDFSEKKLPIRPGDSINNINDLRKKLQLLGHYKSELLPTSYFYDSLTQEAVNSLQKQFGFNDDAIIGKNTLNALNTPISKLQEKLFENMERLRWLPDSLEHRHIFVNIADFHLHFFEGKDTLISMRTVVGRNYRQTPVFHGKMSYLVFSPTWTVPPGILRNDVLPEVRKSTNYLTSKNMVVLDAKGKQVDPSTVDWKKDGMKYIIRQQPGAQNALGKVKFMFPNKHNVYLHDTPSKDLFNRDQRLFSSGCIRVEKAKELSQLLLNDMPSWTEERINNAMHKNNEQTVVLKSPVGVYIYYLTAWSTPNEQIHFREDVYKRDDEIFHALNANRKDVSP